MQLPRPGFRQPLPVARIAKGMAQLCLHGSERDRNLTFSLFPSGTSASRIVAFLRDALTIPIFDRVTALGATGHVRVECGIRDTPANVDLRGEVTDDMEAAVAHETGCIDAGNMDLVKL